ncbi:MAG: YggS family pyridoxal phosphate-dependent enzyme [Wolinella sp.]
MSLDKNLDSAIRRIEAARIAYSRHHIVKILAVSKYSQADEIRKLYGYGQRAFGENKVQDLRQKADALSDIPLEWHFIGTLQSNKINALISLDPALFHSLHSLELARALNTRLQLQGKKMRALLQINSAKEDSKSGVLPEQARECYLQILDECPNIELCGVMSIGAHVDDSRVVRNSFEVAQGIFEALKPQGASILSMGMSGDFELAIACGSNLVRLGSTLFSR